MLAHMDNRYGQQLDMFDPRTLARGSDPSTSHDAAKSLDLAKYGAHRWILGWLADHGPATDDQMGAAAARAGVVPRHDVGRRAARTLREVHDAFSPAVGDDGKQIQLMNESGRMGQAWIVKRGES